VVGKKGNELGEAACERFALGGGGNHFLLWVVAIKKVERGRNGVRFNAGKEGNRPTIPVKGIPGVQPSREEKKRGQIFLGGRDGSIVKGTRIK